MRNPIFHPKTLISLALLVPLFLILSYRTRQEIQNQTVSRSTFEYLKTLQPLDPNPLNFTINLVLATIAADDISWTSRLAHIPNLNVIRYVSDSDNAQYRPKVQKKGRESMIYHTYFHDFYDELPDISIMMHAHEAPWHADPVLFMSMVFALSNLDLQQVWQRGYANLRVEWDDGCPGWINTTKTPEESYKQEEPFMYQAFSENFLSWGADEVPEILGGPCCSQFAVTRDAVLKRPKEQYNHHLQWLVDSSWSDYIIGRTWEHMFQFLFTGKAKDCPVEWKAYCAMYGVCFDSDDTFAAYKELAEEKVRLEKETGFWGKGRKRINELRLEMEPVIKEAMRMGKVAKSEPGHGVGDLYDFW